MKYKVVNDRQGTNWAMGIVQTAEEWRELAITWADSDENEWAIKELEILKGKEDRDILGFIDETWDIEFEEVKDYKYYQIRYVVQGSDNGVLWQDICDCMSAEEAEEEYNELTKGETCE